MKLNENIDYDKIENNVRRMMTNDTVKEKVSIKGLRLSLEKIKFLFAFRKNKNFQ